MKVTTTKPHIYAATRRAVGDEYEIAGAGDLKLYKALGWVTEAPAAAAPIPPIEPARRARKDAKAFEHSDTDNRTTEQVSDHIKAENAPAEKTKRAYRRRDMTAE